MCSVVDEVVTVIYLVLDWLVFVVVVLGDDCCDPMTSWEPTRDSIRARFIFVFLSFCLLRGFVVPYRE